MSHRSFSRRVALALASLLTHSLSGCAAGTAAKNYTVIPESYYEYFGDTPGEDVASIRALGPDYCTRAYRKDGGIVIVANSRQRKNLRKRNDHLIKYYKDLFLEESSEYAIHSSPDFRHLEFVYDEKMDETTQNEAVRGLAYMYVLNQLIDGAGENWSLNITIRNCHTGKRIADVKIPGHAIDFSHADWNESID